MRTAILCLSILALYVPAAQADVGPSFLQPAPSIEVKLENAAEHSGYDFYLKCGCGPGNPFASPQRIAVEEGVGRISGSRGARVTPVYLLAAPHGAELPAVSDDREWLTQPEEGCLQAPLEGGSSSGTHTYRISLEEGQLKATLVASADDSASTRPVGMTIAAGLAGALALATAPLFLRRRRMPPANP